MRKFMYGLLIGLLIGTYLNIAYAKYESGSYDAASVVGYGKYSGTIVTFAVTSDGKLMIR